VDLDPATQREAIADFVIDHCTDDIFVGPGLAPLLHFHLQAGALGEIALGRQLDPEFAFICQSCARLQKHGRGGKWEGARRKID